MESSDVRPYKIRIVYSGKPRQDDGAAAASSSSSTAPGPAEDGEPAYYCPLCPKTFPSVNAMHGHMRVHPYTERMGAPSPVASSTPEPNGPVDPPLPLQSLLSRWSRTAQRTRLVPVETVLTASDGETPVGGPVGQRDVGTYTPVEADVVEEEEEGDAAEEEPATSGISMDAGVGLDNMATPEHCGQSSGRGGSVSCSEEGKDGDLGEEQRSSGLVIGVDRPYACGTCGKSFPSYQALGGHMTSHGRHNSREQSSPVLQGGQGGEGAAVSSTGSSKALKRRRVKAGPEEHRCNLCGREFPTGQALGGHKRLHWEGPKIRPLRLPPPVPLAAAALIPTPEAMENESSLRIHDFDLNELPVDQVKDGGIPQELWLLR